MSRTLSTVGKVPASVEDPRLKDFLESIRQRVNDQDARISTLEALVVVEPWHLIDAVGEPAFENLYVNHSSGAENAAFYKDPFGVVHLKGLVKTGSGVMFTLPTDYRPALLANFVITSNNSFGQIEVSSTGTVDLTTGSTVWASLAGISFRAAQ